MPWRSGGEEAKLIAWGAGRNEEAAVGARRESGALEAEVLAALWSTGTAMTVASVVEALGGGLAYNTVQTILVRLHAKGAVHRELDGRAHVYTPVLDEPGLAVQRMRAALERSGNQLTVLLRFVSSLTVEEESAVADLLAAHRDPPGGAAG